MTVVLTPTDEHKVSTKDGLWMSAADAARVTGWTLKPEGMCRDERCARAALKTGQIGRALKGKVAELSLDRLLGWMDLSLA